MSKFIFITKDAMCTDYMTPYGNSQFSLPNIEELARKGTIFRNHYTSAPSTVMAFYGMATGEWAHNTEFQLYEKKHVQYTGRTLFETLREAGYMPHIVWDDEWDVLFEYVNCYSGAEVHSLHGVRQGVGSHYIHEGFLKEDLEKQENALRIIENEIQLIVNKEQNPFIWLHLPHVIAGKTGYGTDMELFDRFVGIARKYFSDEQIAISADHGNMNGHKGKISYGHDAYNPSIKIPLITPRINNCSSWTGNTTNIDLFQLLIERKIPEREYIYSDTAYRAQKNRKLAIISGKYKYIFNKRDASEELYDLEFDPDENFSIMEDYIYDVDRKINAPSRELYYYPEWDKLPEIRLQMRKEKVRIWRNGDPTVVLKSNLKDLIRPIYSKLHKVKQK